MKKQKGEVCQPMRVHNVDMRFTNRVSMHTLKAHVRLYVNGTCMRTVFNSNCIYPTPLRTSIMCMLACNNLPYGISVSLRIRSSPGYGCLLQALVPMSAFRA